jgi:hypothetical protein
VTTSYRPSEVLAEGLDRLRGLLSGGWEIAPTAEAQPSGGQDADRGRAVTIVTVRPPRGDGDGGAVLVEVKDVLTPSEARDVLTTQVDLMRQLRGQAAVLVISPWLSPRTREVLSARGYGYLDFTGNVSFHLDSPAVLIRMDGAQRDPNPRPRGARSLSAPRAGRLVRVLVDVRPPYRAGELSERCGVSLPYVSRLLDAIEQEALLTRRGRVITDVDWVGLLRARAAGTSLLRMNQPVQALSPAGVRSAVDRLRDTAGLAESVAVTGSAAAAAVAPVAVGGQLMMYLRTDQTALDRVERELGLLRTDEGANVVLLRAGDDLVFERTRVVDGLRHVALSQLALDCLAGTGRMPAEGDAVLGYMIEHETEWRLPGLVDVPRRST